MFTLREVSPELAGRVGRERWRQYQSAKQGLENAPHLVKDKAAEQLRVAQQKLNRNKSTVAKHMRKFKRNIGGEWHQKFKKAAETPRFGETTKDKLKIAGGVAGAAAGAYGAYRLHKWWKNRKAKPAVKKQKEVKPMKKHQDPTQYPFESSTDHAFGQLMEGKFSKYGRGFLSKFVGEKKGYQDLNQARKNLHAAGGPTKSGEAFREYLGKKRALLLKLKQKKVMAAVGFKSKRNLDKAAKAGAALRQHLTKSVPTANVSKRNKAVVAHIAKKMGVGDAKYRPAKTIAEKAALRFGGARYGKNNTPQVLSHKDHAMSSAVVAHELGHVGKKRKSLTHLLDKESNLSSPHSTKKDVTKLLRGIMAEEIKANRTVGRRFKLNRRNRQMLQGAMGSHRDSSVSQAMGGHQPMSALLKTIKQYQKGARSVSRLTRGARYQEATNAVFCRLCETDSALLAAAARMKKRIADDKKRRRLEALMSSLSKKVKKYPGGNAGAGRLYQLSKTAGNLKQSSTDHCWANLTEVSQELALRAAGKASRNILDPKRGGQYSRFVRYAMKKGARAKEKAYLASRTPFSFKGAELFGGGGRIF